MADRGKAAIAFGLLLALVAAPGTGMAQQPSQAQIGAIRQACRNDYMRQCAGVPTGGAAALQCLEAHAASVSASCQHALAAARPPASSASAPPRTVPVAPPSAAAAQPPRAEADATWPHSFTKDGASVTVYQPQAIAWPDQRKLTARAAIAITPAGETRPVLGTVQLTFATAVDKASGVVTLSDASLSETHFPSLDTERAAQFDAKIRAALPGVSLPHVSLAAILLSLGQSPVPSVAVSNDPPTIFTADHPASLVQFDGAPVLAPVGSTGLSAAVNTNWDIFVAHDTWYLLDNGIWLSAPAATGPYSLVARLPGEFNALPNDANFAAVRRYVPAIAPKSAAQVPAIFVSTKPADIIVTEGAPQLAAVPGTGLQRVTNTASALFFDPPQGRFYVLLSGRWFSAAALSGPWEFATANLPDDFALIPADGPAGAVLASVPGTAEAQEAVLRSQIPVTATLERAGAKVTVVYSGPPQFVPIPGTGIEHAVNTASVVLKIADRYYVCENGAWFVAPSPNGPFVPADSLPPAIKTIPPSSPVYPVTYVQVYGATPTTVTYGYTAGYLMGYVSAGVLVYGTGYYYPPYIVAGRVPVYYPYPFTYGSAVHYNPTTGAWVRGGAIYGPYGGGAAGARYYNPTTGGWARAGAIYGPNGGAGAWSAYNPSTGSYAHGSAWWGHGGGTANASFYNGRTGVAGSTNQNWSPYGRWGSSTITGPNQTVHTQSRSNANGTAGGFSSSTGAEGAGYHNRVTGNSGGAVKTSNGDVYAGRDGNVYQHTDDGWSKWNNGGWTPVQPTNRRPSGSGASNTQNAARRGSFDNENYRGLQQDWMGRQAGEGWRGRPSGEGYGGRFRR